jgi:hypothetical protein
VTRVAKHVTLATNPCRIRYWTQEIVVFRFDSVSRLRRHCVVRPKGAQDTASSEGGVADSSSATIDTTLEPDLREHAAATIVSQAHLCPLPSQLQPIYWAHDQGLRLFPLPDLLILADDSQSFDIENVSGSETRIACPGSLVEGQFVMYRPSDRVLEESDLDGAVHSSSSSAPAESAEAAEVIDPEGIPYHPHLVGDDDDEEDDLSDGEPDEEGADRAPWPQDVASALPAADEHDVDDFEW